MNRALVLIVTAALALAGCASADGTVASPSPSSSTGTASPAPRSAAESVSPEPIPTTKVLRQSLLAGGDAHGVWRPTDGPQQASERGSLLDFVASVAGFGSDYREVDCTPSVDLPQTAEAETETTLAVHVALKPKAPAHRRGPVALEALVAANPERAAERFASVRDAWTSGLGDTPFKERGHHGFIRLEEVDLGTVGDDRFAVRIRDIGPNSGNHGWTADNMWWAVVRDGPVLLFVNVNDGWVSDSPSHWPNTYPAPGVSDEIFRTLVNAAVDKLP